MTLPRARQCYRRGGQLYRATEQPVRLLNQKVFVVNLSTKQREWIDPHTCEDLGLLPLNDLHQLQRHPMTSPTPFDQSSVVDINLSDDLTLPQLLAVKASLIAVLQKIDQQIQQCQKQNEATDSSN